jgi:hypothetical protein
MNENGFNVAFLLRQCFKILKSRFFVFFAKKYPIIPIFNDVALANKFSFYRIGKREREFGIHICGISI